MTRTVPSALQSHLDGATTSTATLWTITRRDGGVLRFTDHDRDIAFGGDAYTAAVGYQRSDIAGNATLAVDSLDVQGILNAAEIAESDLRGGRYDYAEVRISLVNWKDPDGDGEVSLRKGWFGEIVFDEVSGSFSTELRGLTQVYSQTIIEQYGRQCRHDIGDGRCNRDNTLPILPDLIAPATAYAVGDVVRVPRVGAASPPITEDFGDTHYVVTVAGTTGSGVDNFPTVLSSAATPATTLSVDDANTFSRAAGSFLDDGWQVDMVLRSSGFANGANNGTFRVAAVSATTLDVTASSLVAEAGDGDEALAHIAYNNGVEFSVNNALRVAGEVVEVVSQSEIIVGPPGGPGGGLLAYPLFFANPGFETGDTTGWTVSEGVVQIHTAATGQVRTGTYSIQIPDNWTGSNYATIEQTVDLSDYASAIDAGGETITTSYWFWSGGGTGVIWVDYDFLDETDSLISSTANGFHSDIGSVWVQFSQTNTIPASTRKIVVKVRGGNGTTEPWLDDFAPSTSLVDPNFPNDEFNYGVLTFDSGDNAGLSMDVKDYDATGKRFTLYLPMPYPIAVGDKIGVHIGCNKEPSRCLALGNKINFGGFEFIPGDDAFLRYPDSPY